MLNDSDKVWLCSTVLFFSDDVRSPSLSLQANSGLQAVVIVEKTRLSEQYFSGLQKFVVLELGLTLLPVSTAAEAAQLIAQMVSHFSVTASF